MEAIHKSTYIDPLALKRDDDLLSNDNLVEVQSSSRAGMSRRSERD